MKYEKESIEAKEELKKIKRIKKQDWFKQAYREYLAKKETEVQAATKTMLGMVSQKDTIEEIFTKERSLLSKIKQNKELLTLARFVKMLVTIHIILMIQNMGMLISHWY